MTDRAPIPAEVFADAVDRLDRDALAGFVARLEAAAGRTVDVDPPAVTVGDGADRERLLVAPEAVALDDTDPIPDAVVVPDGVSTADDDVPVRTTADLRQQLLYSVSPEAAESIAEEWLGMPARSESYAPEPTPTVETDETGDAPVGGSDPGSTASSEQTAPASDDATATAATGATPEPAAEPGGSPTSDGEDGSDAATRSGAGLVVVAVLAATILAVTGGVVYAAEVSPDGDAGAFAAPVPATDGGTLSEAEIRRRSRAPIDASGAITATPTPGEERGDGARPLANDTEVERNVRPVPTCERSFLHVVQIQMNALKYNNNTTDDGIRTVRRFASQRNRQAIPTLEEFARIIKNPTYSPMLSYDSVQYTPIQSSDDYAQVQVLTREDGNVTGQYYFRLRKIEDGDYEGCWMTDAVVSIPETSNFSGKVGGQSTGASYAV
ncbi:hypothetical protein [Halobellus ruber]|uniref:DUF4864 domain-containing protein n=1 Tax=Halobellus ruber TaxID=2761102 RepID=A0A7J9SG74_9EURY|nr:hypothetical protein [Halobellus ruber]MBB6645512.1 hypothetical protein [Halobellus ruber]